MKKIIKGILISCLMLGLFSLVSCAIPAGEKNRNEYLLLEEAETGLKLYIDVEKSTYLIKEPILINLSVSNENRDGPVSLTFPSTQRYDLIIIKEGEEIWRWSKDKLFGMVLEEVILEPGESLKYTEGWDQRNNNGEFVSAGRYEIVGLLKTYSEVVSEPVLIEIK